MCNPDAARHRILSETSSPTTEEITPAVAEETPKGTEDGPLIIEGIEDEIPDEVLRLELEKFEGPFEVLLYLIKSQEIDIFDIPILKVTEQYLRFLEMMEEENLDVAGDFLVMAATLIQIKSKMILPIDLEDGVIGRRTILPGIRSRRSKKTRAKSRSYSIFRSTT